MPTPKVLAIAVENGDTLKKLGDVLGIDLTNIQTLRVPQAVPDAEPVAFGDQYRDEDEDDFMRVTYNAKNLDLHGTKITHNGETVSINFHANDGEEAEDSFDVNAGISRVDAKLDHDRLVVTAWKMPSTGISIPIEQ